MTFEVIFASAFLLVSAAFFLRVLWDVFSARSSRSWPSVSGTITGAHLEEQGRQRRPRVTYRYTVAGRELGGQRVRFGDRFELMLPDAAATTLRKYAAGTSAAVYYDPGDPRKAVLEPGVPWLLLVTLAMATIFVAAGILMLRATL